jgi:hypothetical protein
VCGARAVGIGVRKLSLSVTMNGRPKPSVPNVDRAEREQLFVFVKAAPKISNIDFECMSQARRSFAAIAELRAALRSSVALKAVADVNVRRNVGMSDGRRDVRRDRRIEHVGERRLGKLLPVNRAAFFGVALYPGELRRIEFEPAAYRRQP